MNDLILRTKFVYPGHPVHLAIQIMQNFGSYAEASGRGREYSAALENSNVNGSGGAVHQALFLLSKKDEMTPAELFGFGQDLWRRSREGGDFEHNLEAGAAAADDLRERFMADVAGWPTAAPLDGIASNGESV